MEEMNSEEVNIKTGELVEQPNKLVFGTQEAEGIIAKATQVANRLVDIVEKAKLYNLIKGKKFVRVEGWTAMGAMLGVFPSLEYCRRLDRENETIYESRIVLKTIAGVQVGAGEAICSSKESTWSTRDEYTIKSMSQTRAIGKAFRLSFSWIMVMGGYEACNAEEMASELPPTTPIKMPTEKLGSPEIHTVKGTKPFFGPQEDPVGRAKAALAAQAPGPMTPEAIDAALRPPESKFFAPLHKIAREKKIDPEKLKKAIKTFWDKDSSKDLTDKEATELIKMIEKGAIK